MEGNLDSKWQAAANKLDHAILLFVSIVELAVIVSKSDFASGILVFGEYFSEFSGVFFRVFRSIFPNSAGVFFSGF